MMGATSIWQLRVTMFVLSFLYLIAGIITFQYPPDYLAFSNVWALLFFSAGWGPTWVLIVRKAWLAAVVGGMMVGAAMFRGFAILVEVGPQRFLRAIQNQAEETVIASFAIGGLTWIALGSLLWLVWPPMVARILAGERDAE